jgi:thiamine kinase-like enzyme
MAAATTAIRPWGDDGPEVLIAAEVEETDRAAIEPLLRDWDRELFGTGPVELLPLIGGANNRNYTVSGPGVKYALRMANANAERLAVDRASAIRAQTDAAAVGVAPKLLCSRLPEGHLLSEFCEGEVLREPAMQDREVLREIGTTFRRLHAAPTGCRSFSPFDDIRRWADCAREDGTPVADDVPDLLAIVDRVEQTMLAAELPRVFCHNDTVPQNFIRAADGVRLVDWDYAGVGWAAFEIASFCATAGVTPDLREALLEAYSGGGSEAQLATLDLLGLVAAAREVTWAYMATPMLKGTTELLDGWTYEGYLDANLELARKLAGAGDLGQSLARAASGRGREW